MCKGDILFMSIYSIFTKQGGMNLIKQYWKSGALFTAISEFLILGKEKKALEILRLSAAYKTKRKLEKKYASKLSNLEMEYDTSLVHKQSDKIWICWFQGIENAPDIVKECIDSIKENIPSKEVIIITEKNYSQYVNFPEYILQKWKEGVITHTHMTDLLRLELLLKFGGTWIDATVLCTAKESEIPDYYFNSDLFLFQTLKPGRDGESTFISSWYMSACTNNKILWLTRELLYEYWKNNNFMIDYFLLHDFLCIVLEHHEDEWKNIVPKDNATPHILLLRLFDLYKPELYEDIRKQTPFHKLSYKFTDEQKQQMNTFYKFLFE